MRNSRSLGNGNFGLSHSGNKKTPKSKSAEYDNWFWESKSQKKMRADQKSAEIERMRAETAAMQQILSEQDNSQESGIGVGKIALIGGLVVLLGIGAVVLIKKKQSTTNIENPISTNDLTV
jgi:hypothetical protein